MKVFIDALGATSGGAVRHLTSFVEELGRQDHSNTFTVSVRESMFIHCVPRCVDIERVPDSAASNWLRRMFCNLWSTPKRLRSEDFSAAVTLLNFGPISPGVPHVCFQRNALYFSPIGLSPRGSGRPLEMRMRRRIAIEAMRRADIIVTPSRTMADLIREAHPDLARASIRVIHHGFTPSAFSQGPLAEYVPLIEDGRPRLFYPADIEFHKGIEILLEALSKVKERVPDILQFLTFSASDPNPLAKQYSAEIRRLRLTENVRLLGRLRPAEVGAFYRCSHLLVFPSLCESFGFPLLEAMALGLPIVAADTSIAREICQDAALFYSPGDPEACAEAIIEALSADRSRMLCERGQKRVAEYDWSWSRYVREFLEVLDQVA